MICGQWGWQKRVGAWVLLVMLSGCGNQTGSPLEYGDSRLYYGPNVTAEEAKLLGDFFEQLGVFNTASRFRLSRDDEGFLIQATHQIAQDRQALAAITEMARTISKSVFEGVSVRIELVEQVV